MRSKQLLSEVKTKTISTYTQLRYQRKARLYCVGTAKSGTHSVDSMFDNTVSSQHEPDDEEVICKILEIAKGQGSKAEALTYLRKRDRRLCLDVDSSQLNFFFLDYLLEEFPDAFFLLTIRDCYSWLDSFINHSLHLGGSKNWSRLRDYRFRSEIFSHSPEEHVLKEKGLYTLDGYLSYWANHNNKVLSSVPQDRLMIVRTDEITQKAYNIADFASLPRKSVAVKKSHAFKNPHKSNVLQQIKRTYLEAKVQRFCEPLMSHSFQKFGLWMTPEFELIVAQSSDESKNLGECCCFKVMWNKFQKAKT